MNKKINFSATFNSQNPIGLIHSICSNIQPFNQKLPSMLTDGYDEHTDTKDWIDKLLPTYKFSATAYWGYGYIGEKEEGFIIYKHDTQLVTIKINDFELVNVENVIKMLAPLPWTVANFHDVYYENCDSEWDEYIPPGFADGHGGHGWACAFKGEGHNHLVSRRWLEYHPWRLIRDEENDISFVQFHDLDADPATALEQARPGHRAMSIYGVGGYIGKTHPFSNDLRGVYLPDTRNLRVVIPERKQITYSEMSDYCAARHFQAFEGKPVDILSFVFIVAAEAQPYIYDLWLREIECFGITEQAKEVRLDEDYYPVYEPPEWVRKLESA